MENRFYAFAVNLSENILCFRRKTLFREVVSAHKNYNLVARFAVLHLNSLPATFNSRKVEFYLPHSEVFMMLKDIDFS